MAVGEGAVDAGPVDSVIPGAAGIVELAAGAAVGEAPTAEAGGAPPAVGEAPTPGAIDAPAAGDPELADAETVGGSASGTGREA